MRSAALILAGLVCATLAGLAIAALTQDRTEAFALGVARSGATEVKRGSEVCQAPIAVPAGAGFDGVTFAVGTSGRPGPALDISIRPADPDPPFAVGRGVIARSSLPSGYADVTDVPDHTVWFDRRIQPGQSIAVCFANETPRRPAFVYGDVDAASRTTSAFIAGAPTGTDLALEFERRDARSLGSLIPAMLERAALFRAQWIGVWTYWLLGALVLLAVPALIVLAIRAAARDTA
jgi:hypothetical protein